MGSGPQERLDLRLTPALTERLEHLASRSQPVVLRILQSAPPSGWRSLMEVMIGVAPLERGQPPRFPPSSPPAVKIDVKLDAEAQERVRQCQQGGRRPTFHLIGLPRGVRIFAIAQLTPPTHLAQRQQRPSNQIPVVPAQAPMPAQTPAPAPVPVPVTTRADRGEAVPSDTNVTGLRRGFLQRLDHTGGSAARQSGSRASTTNEQAASVPEAPRAQSAERRADSYVTGVSATPQQSTQSGDAAAEEETGRGRTSRVTQGSGGTRIPRPNVQPTATVVQASLGVTSDGSGQNPAALLGNVRIQDLSAMLNAVQNANLQMPLPRQPIYMPMNLSGRPPTVPQAAAASQPPVADPPQDTGEDAGNEGSEGNILQEIPEAWMCPICMSVMDQPMVTPCGHHFCQSCLATHVRTSLNSQSGRQPTRRPACPMCRTTLPEVPARVDEQMRAEMAQARMRCPNVAICRYGPFSPLHMKNHEAYCGGVRVRCPHMSFGCGHECLRLNLADHLRDCPYEKVKGLYPRIFGSLRQSQNHLTMLQNQLVTSRQALAQMQNQVAHVASSRLFSLDTYGQIVMSLFVWPESFGATMNAYEGTGLKLHSALYIWVTVLFCFPMLLLALSNFSGAGLRGPLLPGVSSFAAGVGLNPTSFGMYDIGQSPQVHLSQLLLENSEFSSPADSMYRASPLNLSMLVDPLTLSPLPEFVWDDDFLRGSSCANGDSSCTSGFDPRSVESLIALVDKTPAFQANPTLSLGLGMGLLVQASNGAWDKQRTESLYRWLQLWQNTNGHRLGAVLASSGYSIWGSCNPSYGVERAASYLYLLQGTYDSSFWGRSSVSEVPTTCFAISPLFLIPLLSIFLGLAISLTITKMNRRRRVGGRQRVPDGRRVPATPIVSASAAQGESVGTDTTAAAAPQAAQSVVAQPAEAQPAIAQPAAAQPATEQSTASQPAATPLGDQQGQSIPHAAEVSAASTSQDAPGVHHVEGSGVNDNSRSSVSNESERNSAAGSRSASMRTRLLSPLLRVTLLLNAVFALPVISSACTNGLPYLGACIWLTTRLRLSGPVRLVGSFPRIDLPFFVDVMPVFGLLVATISTFTLPVGLAEAERLYRSSQTGNAEVKEAHVMRTFAIQFPAIVFAALACGSLQDVIVSDAVDFLCRIAKALVDPSVTSFVESGSNREASGTVDAQRTAGATAAASDARASLVDSVLRATNRLRSIHLGVPALSELSVYGVAGVCICLAAGLLCAGPASLIAFFAALVARAGTTRIVGYIEWHVRCVLRHQNIQIRRTMARSMPILLFLALMGYVHILAVV